MWVKTYGKVNGKLEIQIVDLSRFIDSSYPVLKEGTIYDELLHQLASFYRIDCNQLLIYWKDAEGEFITVENNDDLFLAYSILKRENSASLLRLYITSVNGLHVSEEFSNSKCDNVDKAIAGSGETVDVDQAASEPSNFTNSTTNNSSGNSQTESTSDDVQIAANYQSKYNNEEEVDDGFVLVDAAALPIA